jgi:hypothetical protein
MKINKQRGFTVVEGLLIFIIIGIIGGTSWYVVHANSKTNDTLNNAGLGSAVKSAKKKQISPVTVAPADPTANWITYSSKTGKYLLKYPPSWTKAVPVSGCDVDDSLLLLGGNSNSAGKYCSDGDGQITITWRQDRALCGDLDSESWDTNSKESVTVSGVKGTKIIATAKDQGQQLLGSVPEGTKTVQYCFVANNMTYIADYTKLSAYPDVLNDFDLMVAKTLKFSAN